MTDISKISNGTVSYNIKDAEARSGLNGKLDGFTLRFAGNWTGGVHAVNFVTIDYSECNSENGVFIKFSMVNSHGNGQAGKFLQDVVLNVKYTGEVAGTLYRYFAVPIDQASSEYYGSHYYGDVFWVNDTTNKIVKFYVLMHQYSYTSQSPYFRLNASTKGVIAQSTGGAYKEEYSSGTIVWTTVNWFETDQTYSATSAKPQSGLAVASAISGKANSADLATVATTGSYNDLSNKPTIPTVNNATLTIQKNGTTVNTFTANASSSVTANITVPTTTTSVTSGSTAALTSGGAYTNLVRRYSTSSATGSSTQGVYVNASGQIQPCTAVTSTYSQTGTAPVNGKAIASAISGKQDNLVSGTNIKTINDTSILGSGNIDIAVKNVRDGSILPIWYGTDYQWNNGEQITWYYWQTSETALWTESTLPASQSWSSIIYGDGKFVAIAGGKGYTAGNASNKAAYSTDGINWTETTMPSSRDWSSVTYGDGKFVAIAFNSNGAAYSTDGINWTASTLPSSVRWASITYGNGKFVAVAGGRGYSGGNNSNGAAYSTDGINWIASTLPSSGTWTSVTYGDGKFVAVGGSLPYYSDNASNIAIYSTDGINWTESTLPASQSWASVTYGDGKFVAVACHSDKATYSTDGINWIETTLPSSSNCTSVTYGDGKFVAVTGNNTTSRKAIFSLNGINWTESSMSNWIAWSSVTYGDDKFVVVGGNGYQNKTDKLNLFYITFLKCYTDTANPTVSSIAYNAPEVTSSYRISSVTNGAITLSNSNTYYYNQAGNQYTYRTIGDAHPEYLCFIDGVGVKIGNNWIATNNFNNS